MTFEQLRLAMAIKRSIKGWKEIVTTGDRLAFALVVSGRYAELTDDVYFPFVVDDVMSLYTRLRKNKITRLKAEVALVHGSRCFWEHRSKGACCNIAELGHLVPRSKGGGATVGNMVIECRSHNNQRRDMTVEEYIASEMAIEGREEVCRAATHIL